MAKKANKKQNTITFYEDWAVGLDELPVLNKAGIRTKVSKGARFGTDRIHFEGTASAFNKARRLGFFYESPKLDAALKGKRNGNK